MIHGCLLRAITVPERHTILYPTIIVTPFDRKTIIYYYAYRARPPFIYRSLNLQKRTISLFFFSTLFRLRNKGRDYIDNIYLCARMSANLQNTIKIFNILLFLWRRFFARLKSIRVKLKKNLSSLWYNLHIYLIEFFPCGYNYKSADDLECRWRINVYGTDASMHYE